MKLTDFNTEGKLGFVTAGESLTRKDPVYLDGLSGKGYKITTTDFAAIGTMTYGTAQTSAATGMILAQTSLISSKTDATQRQAVVKNSSGDIFTLTDYATGQGVKLTKLRADGSVASTVNVATDATNYYSHHLLELSNGNLAALYINATNVQYAVYDANLVQIKAPTGAVDAAASHFSACAISSGGFAIVAQDSITPLTSVLLTFDNSGVAVLASTVIWTRTGTTGTQLHKIAQLSNGNLAYAVSSTNTGASIGLYHGVTTTSGSVVAAFSALSTVSYLIYPELSVMSGYYAVSRADGTDQKGFVLSNAGALQGAEFSSATSNGNTNNQTKLVNDGTAFYLIWHRTSDSKCVITKLPTTGTNYVTNIITTTTTQFNFALDAMYENGFICAISMTATNTKPTMWVVNVSTLSLVSASGTEFGASPGTSGGTDPRIISGGDRTFIALYDYTSTQGTFLCVGKWAQTAVLGVAATTVAANSSVALNTMAGCYEINAIGGTASKSFDMTTNTLVGNKGALVAKGACTLRGIGA